MAADEPPDSEIATIWNESRQAWLRSEHLPPEPGEDEWTQDLDEAATYYRANAERILAERGLGDVAKIRFLADCPQED